MIPADKQLHFWASMAGALAFGLFFGTLLAVIFTLTIGLIKELIWDHGMKRRDPDPMDMAANIAGIGAAAIILNLANPWTPI